MFNKNSTKIKEEKQIETLALCPIMDSECLGASCAWYHEKCKNCIFQILVYNVFTLNNLLKEAASK